MFYKNSRFWAKVCKTFQIFEKWYIILSMKKNFKILAIFIILTVVLIVFDNLNYKKYYNSFLDKKEAQKIQSKLETTAYFVQKHDTIKYIDTNYLTKRNINRFCIIPPYFPDADKFINITWKNFPDWQKDIINQQEFYSLILIEKENVLPIKILTYKLKPQKAVCKDNNAVFKIYKQDFHSYLDIE